MAERFQSHEPTKVIPNTGGFPRARLFRFAGALGSAALLAACNNESQTITSSAPPVSLLAGKPDAQAAQEVLIDSRFEAAIAAGKALEAKHPKEFAGAGNISKRLQGLVRTNEFSVDNNNPEGFAIVRNPIPTVQNGVIIGFNKTLAVSDIVFNLRPEVQVMVLLHELGHYDDITNNLKPFIGKPNTPEVQADYQRKFDNYRLTAEMKELFRNCQQLAALKSEDPNFSAYPVPYELKIPRLNNRSIYDVFRSVKFKDYNNDFWMETILTYQETINSPIKRQ